MGSKARPTPDPTIPGPTISASTIPDPTIPGPTISASTSPAPTIMVRDGGVLLDPGPRRETTPEDLRSYHLVGYELLTVARRTGRGQAASAAVEVLRAGLTHSPRDPSLRNGLGAALVERARFEAATASLATLRQALGEFQVASDLVGASAAARAARLRYDINRAMVLWMIGERTADADSLGLAATTLRAAGDALPTASVHWQHVQDNLGNAFMALGRTAEAIAAYQTALTARSTDPDRARVLNNLGTAYVTQGRYSDGDREFLAALALMPRDLMPLDWSRAQHNRGSALLQQALANPRPPAAGQRFGDAIKALELAREERVRERVPMDWAVTTANLACAYVGLGVSLTTAGAAPGARAGTTAGSTPGARAGTTAGSTPGTTQAGAAHLRHALNLYREALPDLASGDQRAIERNVGIAEELLRRISGPPDKPSGVRWPNETYTQARTARKETIIDYLTRVWLPLIQAGEVDLRTLRVRDPSAAKAVDNYMRRIDPVTGQRRRLPSHLHLPTQKEVNDRLAAGFTDPGNRPARLDWVLRARKRRSERN